MISLPGAYPRFGLFNVGGMLPGYPGNAGQGAIMRRLLIGGIALVALAAGSAMAADMPVKAPIYKAPPAIVPYNWSGFYVSANVGYGWGQSSNSWNFFAPADNLALFHPGTTTICPPNGFAFCASGSDANKLNGAIGGLQAGYNWQTGKFLAGVETDFQLSSQNGSQLFSTGDPRGQLFDAG